MRLLPSRALQGLDIGPKSIDLLKDTLKGAKTVIWNGPMGGACLPRSCTAWSVDAHRLMFTTEARLCVACPVLRTSRMQGGRHATARCACLPSSLPARLPACLPLQCSSSRPSPRAPLPLPTSLLAWTTASPSSAAATLWRLSRRRAWPRRCGVGTFAHLVARRVCPHPSAARAGARKGGAGTRRAACNAPTRAVLQSDPPPFALLRLVSQPGALPGPPPPTTDEPHLHRWRRVPGAPRGQGAAW